MKKRSPTSREIKISILISAVVVFAVLVPSIYSMFSPRSTNGSAAGTFSVGTPQLNPGATDLASSSASTSGRVVETSEALVGYIKHGGAFENVTGIMLSDLNSEGGFVNSSNLMYNGTTWFGVWNVEVPPTNATAFLFTTNNLVNQNGNTTSIDISTQDVTNQTGGNQSVVPFSPFSINLQELAENSRASTHTSQFSGLSSSVLAILTVVLDGAVYVLAVAVPTFLLVLGGVLISRRVLYPILLRVSGRSSTAKAPGQ
jgi:hypothetical protein